MDERNRIRCLVQRAKKGDRSAFDELFREHRNRLLSFVQVQIGEKIRQYLEPEDVIQETFVRALETIDRFEWRAKNSFFSWLAAIAGHLVLNASKKTSSID